MADVLEWWPDYGHGPLVDRRGVPADVDRLGMSEETVSRLRHWGSEYAEDKLPIDGPGDRAWVQQGIELLVAVRRELADRYQVVVTEPWSGEPPSV